MKECFKCHQTKPLLEFYKHSAMTDGHLNKCKECTKKDSKNRDKKLIKQYDEFRQRNNIIRIFTHRYRGMLQRVQGRAIRTYKVYGTDICTKQEFLDWCWDDENFEVFIDLFIDWQNSDYNPKLTPSIDRIDNEKGYTIDNIQWLTKSANSHKYVSKVL